MTPAIVLLLADRASDVSGGAVLTLAIPLGLLLITLALGYMAFRRASRH
jgi:ABC-type nickel/cobalt efflux system permease component RcnA